jgi:hypothetical protein
MPLTEFEAKEALRAATDWLATSSVPGVADAQEGIANTIPLIMMGTVVLQDLDELAALVEESSRTPGEPDGVRRVQVKEAVTAAFDHVRSLSSDSK